jgi:hypothetical protein
VRKLVGGLAKPDGMPVDVNQPSGADSSRRLLHTAQRLKRERDDLRARLNQERIQREAYELVLVGAFPADMSGASGGE